MTFINLKQLANIETLAIVVISLQLLAQTAICQVTDGEDQFQDYNQDIGRISGGAINNAPVAQPAVVVPVAPAPVVPSIEPVAPAYQRGRHHLRQSAARQPVARVASLGARVRPAPVVVEAPAVIPAPAPAPAYVGEPSSHQIDTSSQYLQPVPVAQPQHVPTLARHTSAPTLVAEQIQTVGAGPALSSFRSTTGHSNSVAARHSALMAQVAAERQAAATTAGDYAPLEALTSPALAQVQPPPTVQHYQPTAAASPSLAFVDQPEEPVVAPSFDHILSNGCPHKGVFSYPNKDHCDRYYMCTNGTFTEEACPNGLAYGQMGAVYQHCAYNWNVDCGNKKTSEPIASPGCPWQFGIFPVSSAGRCSLDYFVCEWGVPETKRCSPEGLFYDDRIKGCQWADQLGCKSEAVLNFKCPAEDEDNPYWPYPRYYHTKQDVVVCVNEQPRLVHCNEDQIVDPSSLACVDLNKKKKKF